MLQIGRLTRLAHERRNLHYCDLCPSTDDAIRLETPKSCLLPVFRSSGCNGSSKGGPHHGTRRESGGERGDILIFNFSR